MYDPPQPHQSGDTSNHGLIVDGTSVDNHYCQSKRQKLPNDWARISRAAGGWWILCLLIVLLFVCFRYDWLYILSASTVYRPCWLSGRRLTVEKKTSCLLIVFLSTLWVQYQTRLPGIDLKMEFASKKVPSYRPVTRNCVDHDGCGLHNVHFSSIRLCRHDVFPTYTLTSPVLCCCHGTLASYHQRKHKVSNDC